MGDVGVRCPYCRADDDRVVDSRPAEDGYAIRRRRLCKRCGRRYTTYERVERFPLRVLKKDGRREDYSREKIQNGIIKACSKLPVSDEQIQQVVDNVEKRVLSYEVGEVPTSLIGRWVMEELKRLHEVAYIRFASVYKRFMEAADFVKAAQQVEERSPED